jgi:hypothetical protein
MLLLYIAHAANKEYGSAVAHPVLLVSPHATSGARPCLFNAPLYFYSLCPMTNLVSPWIISWLSAVAALNPAEPMRALTSLGARPRPSALTYRGEGRGGAGAWVFAKGSGGESEQKGKSWW